MPNRRTGSSESFHPESFSLGNDTIQFEFGDSWERELTATKDWIPSDDTLSAMLDFDVDTSLTVSSFSETELLNDSSNNCFWTSRVLAGNNDSEGSNASTELAQLNHFSQAIAGDYSSVGLLHGPSPELHLPNDTWDISQELMMRYPVAQDDSLALEQRSTASSADSSNATKVQPGSIEQTFCLEHTDTLKRPDKSQSGSTADLNAINNTATQGVWDWLLEKEPFQRGVPSKIIDRDDSEAEAEKGATNGRRGHSEKHDKRKSKPIAKRFRAYGSVGVTPSFVQCLNVVLNYHGYTGTIRTIVINEAITNVAYQRHDPHQQARKYKRALEEYYTLGEGEQLVGCVPNKDPGQRRISLISGTLQRKIHIRDISEITNSVRSIAYVVSERFHINNPYEPQYYRFELDDKGKVVNESKCGLCAFCPTVKFLPFKNSSYLSHMTLEHGVFASNYIVPEGLYYGKYLMLRATDPAKTRVVKALQCPACFQIIEVSCWKNKTNPLLSYFRHFKKMHSNLNKTFTVSSTDPAGFKHRVADPLEPAQCH